jgi:predicted ABC-type ATPase
MRVEGRSEAGGYVVAHDGVMKRYTRDEALADTKLQAAIKRNGWEPVNGD